MTTPDERKARVIAYYEGDYAPNQNVEAQHRIGNALEYIAFSMGRLRMAVEEINERQKAQTGR